jgi:hypothetical protein
VSGYLLVLSLAAITNTTFGLVDVGVDLSKRSDEQVMSLRLRWPRQDA